MKANGPPRFVEATRSLFRLRMCNTDRQRDSKRQLVPEKIGQCVLPHLRCRFKILRTWMGSLDLGRTISHYCIFLKAPVRAGFFSSQLRTHCVNIHPIRAATTVLIRCCCLPVIIHEFPAVSLSEQDHTVPLDATKQHCVFAKDAALMYWICPTVWECDRDIQNMKIVPCESKSCCIFTLLLLLLFVPSFACGPRPIKRCVTHLSCFF